MFKTLAQYRALHWLLRSRSPANDAAKPVPANDNRQGARQSGPHRRTLVCQWYPADGGDRLAIRWRLDIATPGIEPLESPRSRPAQRHAQN